MSFTVGLNVPWIECGHDFGPRPPEWSGAPPTDWGHLERKLSDARADGVEVVRFWLLAGGVNYPVGRDPDDVFTRRGDRFVLARDQAAPELPDAYLRDFEGLLRACTNAGVRVVPVLCSFELFFPMEPQGRRVVSGGRGAIALGDHDDEAPRRVRAFLDATLSPLLEVTRDHASSVEAFEVCNEPDWVVRGGPLHVRLHGRRIERMPKTVSALAMSVLIEEAVNRVVDAGLVSTVGFKQSTPRWLSPSAARWLEALARQGRYLHQLHYYPSLHEPAPLPSASRSPYAPVVVGEMPIAQGRWLDPFFMRWLDGGPMSWAVEADPHRYLEQRLELVASRGYAGAWLWSAHGTDAASAWGPSQRAQVRRFVARRR